MGTPTKAFSRVLCKPSEVIYERTRREVQLQLWYSHFETTKFSQYQFYIDPVAGMLKSGIGNAFIFQFVAEKELITFRAKNGCNLKHEEHDLEQNVN